MEKAVEVKGLRFKYQRGKGFALDGIDFEQKKGDAMVRVLVVFLVLVIGMRAFSWARVLDFGGEDYGISGIGTKDGGYVVIGNSYKKGTKDSELLIIKLDGKGELVWERSYGGGAEELGKAVIEEDDGYLVLGVSGSYGSGGRDAWVLKVNKDGDKVWERFYGGAQDDWPSSIKRVDGGYIISGYIEKNGPFFTDFWVLRIDENGRKVWERTYDKSAQDRGYSLALAKDSGYFLAGVCGPMGLNFYDYCLVRIDDKGDKLWDRVYGGRRWELGYAIEPFQEGGYLLAGMSGVVGLGELYRLAKVIGGVLPGGSGFVAPGRYDVWVMRLDDSGEKVWEKSYGGSEDDRIYAMRNSKDGGYVLVGRSRSYGSGDYSAWIFKIDKAGELVWSRVCGGEGDDGAFGIEALAEGFLVVGYTSGVGSKDFLVLRMDEEGDCGCELCRVNE